MCSKCHIKNWRINNKEREKETDRQWRINNRKRDNENKRLWLLNKEHNDLNYKLRMRVSSRIKESIKNNSGYKIYNTIKLLGCSIQECRKFLEKQFKEDMTWNNYGEWHIDHIRPCASFDLTKEEEQLKCFHYTNLQPLWAEENWTKGATI